MRFLQALSCEFPNDNPRLHQGASWLCLDPLAAARAVARPDAIAKAGGLPSRAVQAQTKAPALSEQGSTLLPQSTLEAEQFIHRFITRVAGSRAPDVHSISEQSPLRLAPIAQFMLEELPHYRLRKIAANVPAPPAHVYGDLVPAGHVVAAEPAALPDESSAGVHDEIEHLVSEIRELRPTVSCPLDFALAHDGSPLAVVEAKFAAIDENWCPAILVADEAAHVDSVDSVDSVRPAATPVHPALEPRETNAYGEFVAALSDVLLQQGATRAAALVVELLEHPRLDAAAVGETLGNQLALAGIGVLRGDQFIVNEAFSEAAGLWRGVLRGELSDFASCADTLDEWATRMVMALLPCAGSAKETRRDLRRRGVAAFGMLAAAA